ncbi:hypothetical protein Tco_0267422 [Tanacetum coccineum]
MKGHYFANFDKNQLRACLFSIESSDGFYLIIDLRQRGNSLWGRYSGLTAWHSRRYPCPCSSSTSLHAAVLYGFPIARNGSGDDAYIA